MHKRYLLGILIAAAMLASGCEMNQKKPNQLGQPVGSDFTADASAIREDASPVDIQYQYKYVKKISGEFPAEFISLVSKDEFSKWGEQFAGKHPQGTRNTADMSLITFIREFNISKQAFTKANDKLKQQDDGTRSFTQKEIDTLYSNETSLINKTFVNPEALLYKGEIYTLEWFAQNDISAYQRVGFPADILLEKIEQWKLSSEFSVQKTGILLATANINSYVRLQESTKLTQAEDFLFHAEYCWDFYNVPPDFAALVAPQSFEEWANQFKAVNFDGPLPAEGYTIANFISVFGISKESFAEVNTRLRNEGTRIFTDEQVEALFSNDIMQINHVLANPSAVLYEDRIYPPKWFADSDVATIAQSGIPLEVIQQKCIEWEQDNTFNHNDDALAIVKSKIAELEIQLKKNPV